MMAESAQKTMVVPVNVIVGKHYRTYVECPLNADDEMIRTLTAQHIMDGQDSVLVRDPDFNEIEPLDIRIDEIDYDGIQLE